jgi:magnesium/cobalt transport protein CorA
MQIVYLSENLTETLNTLKALPSQGYIWINSNTNELDQVQVLLNSVCDINIDDNHLADIRNDDHPAAHDNGNGYELLIVRHLLPVADQLSLKTQPVAFIVADRIVVTISHPEPVLNTIYEQVMATKKRPFKTPEGLVHFLLNKIVDQFLKIRPVISEQQATWQKKLLHRGKPFNHWESLFTYRNQIAQLAVLCELQQDAIEMWAQNMDEDLFNRLAVRLNDLKSHNTRVMYFAKKAEDEIGNLIQLHYAIVGHRTNEIIRILAIISGVFLPLTLITGIFGMNFAYMPVLQVHQGYHITLVIMTVLAVGLLLFFKNKKWI